MDKFLVNEIIKEYEKKRFQKEQLVDNRKKELILKYKELARIEDKIHKVATENIKSIFSNPENKDKKLKNLEKELSKLKKQKEQFIKKIKLPKGYLEIQYDCNKCNDTGFIKKENKLERCSCLKQKIININYNKSNLSLLELENFEKFDLKYYSDKSDKDKYSTDKSPRENMKEIEKLAKDFVKNFDIEKENLLFSGDTGLRKNFFNKCNCKRNIRKRIYSFLSESTKYVR